MTKRRIAKLESDVKALQALCRVLLPDGGDPLGLVRQAQALAQRFVRLVRQRT